MRVLKEWKGLHNSSLLLQDWCFDDGEKHVTILYCYGFDGIKYEGKEDFRVEELENNESALCKLIQTDFDAGCFNELKQTLNDYFDGIESRN